MPSNAEMTNGVHSDFLTVAEAMTSAFSSIENNQDWDLMPSLVPELALCLHMLQRELNLNALSWNMKKVNKQMME